MTTSKAVYYEGSIDPLALGIMCEPSNLTFERDLSRIVFLRLSHCPRLLSKCYLGWV
jgi:hypothetical protein